MEKGKQIIKRGEFPRSGEDREMKYVWFVLQLSSNLSPLIPSHSAAVVCRRRAPVYKSNIPFAINSSSAVITR